MAGAARSLPRLWLFLALPLLQLLSPRLPLPLQSAALLLAAMTTAPVAVLVPGALAAAAGVTAAAAQVQLLLAELAAQLPLLAWADLAAQPAAALPLAAAPAVALVERHQLVAPPRRLAAAEAAAR